MKKKQTEKIVSVIENEIVYLFQYNTNTDQSNTKTMEPQNNMLETNPDIVEKKHTILVAEDIDSNFALVDIILRKDFKIIRATNGNDAIQLFKEFCPSLILMDIQMPELNGLEATRIIRSLDGQIPILALTAFAFNSDRMDFLEAGGSDYIIKPIDPMQLRAKIKDILA